MESISTPAPLKNLLFEEYFLAEIKDIYWTEKLLAKKLLIMKLAAGSAVLRNAFADQLEIARKHIESLEKAFTLMNRHPKQKKCEIMERITQEGQYIIDSTNAGSVTRDTGLIHTAQKVAHYKISTYRGLMQLARTLGYTELGTILKTALSEEKASAELLTGLAVYQHIDETNTEKEQAGTKAYYFDRRFPLKQGYSYLNLNPF
jgi:ferritin-like metal-binding protein YciE